MNSFFQALTLPFRALAAKFQADDALRDQRRADGVCTDCGDAFDAIDARDMVPGAENVCWQCVGANAAP